MKTSLILGALISVPSLRFNADKGASGGKSAVVIDSTKDAQPYELPPVPPVAETTEIELKKIVIDAGTQPRVAIDDEVVKEYTDVIKNCIKDEQPIPFPAVTVFRDETGRCVLADGFHRFAAHKGAHAKEILCEVRPGSERDALIYSLGANQTHGVRRTNKDKQRAVKIAVNDPEFATLGNTEIARLCGVSEFMIREMRPAKNAASTRSVTIRGKKTTMNVSAIGKGKGGGKKGAKAAKKDAKKAAQAGKAAAATKSNAAGDAQKELDIMLGKIADNVGAEGGKFRAAVLDGSLQLSVRDIRDMSSMAAAKQKAIMPLVIGSLRMKPAKAFDFIGSELPEKIRTELHNRAIGTTDGVYTFDGDGFKVVVTLNKRK